MDEHDPGGLTDDEWGALREWMDGEGLGTGSFDDVQPLAGGTQNLMARFDRAGETYVIRRGPRHLRPKSNDAIGREMQVLAALADTDVPHPHLIAACPDTEVLGGAVFYLMTLVDGFNPTVEQPETYRAHPSWWHEAALAMVDGAVALGSVDHAAVGLADLGRPDGFLARQVPRWLDELASYDRHEGYPGPELPGLDEVASWLRDHEPADFVPGLMHGDYHLANVLFAPDRPALAAIVDWEMCTVGDPLLDLGWMLATWPGHGGVSQVGAGELPGLPGPDELVARYAERSGRDLSDVTWYDVMARFKLGIILEGTHARACAGKAGRDVGDLLHALALGLLGSAHQIVQRH